MPAIKVNKKLAKFLQDMYRYARRIDKLVERGKARYNEDGTVIMVRRKK